MPFNGVFGAKAWRSSQLPVRSPVANSFAERWVGTVRLECLDHLLIMGRRRLEQVLRESVEHYQEARPHQGLGQRTPSSEPAVEPAGGRVVQIALAG
jgi:putative transposase